MNQPEVSKDEIFKRLRDVLVAGFELRDEQIVPTARLIDDLELDSLDLSSNLVQVSGRVAGSVHDVAVESHGTIVAVVPAEAGRFWALVPRAELSGFSPRLYSIESATALRRLKPS